MVVGPAQWGTCICTVSNVARTPALACWNNNIATTGPTDHDIVILDALTGSKMVVLSGHTGWVNSLAYSLDGTFLVSGSSDKTIKLWDVQTGGVIKTLCGHTSEVCSVSISADDTMIASASQEAICLWDIRTGSCCVIKRNASTVTFSPTNPQFLSSSDSGPVQQWDINGHSVGSPVPGDHVAFSPDGTQFVSWEWGTFTIRNTDSKTTVATFNVVGEAHSCCFSPNGRFIAVAVDTAIFLWDITGPEPYLIQTFIGHDDSITSLVFASPYNIISASEDNLIKFWQISVSSADSVLPDSKSSSITFPQISFVSLQARDGLAFSIDLEGVVKTWDILTGCCREAYETQIVGIEEADIQLIDDRLIIVWKEMFQQNINVWDIEKGKVQTIEIADWHGCGLRIIGDGSRVLQICEDSIQAWNIWTGEAVYKERLESGTKRFDPLRMDGSKVLVRSGESSIQGWDFETPGSTPTQLPENFPGKPHLNLIDVTHWSEDSPVRIEDSITGKEVFQLCGRYAKPAATEWDGQYLIAGYSSGEVLILDFGNALS